VGCTTPSDSPTYIATANTARRAVTCPARGTVTPCVGGSGPLACTPQVDIVPLKHYNLLPPMLRYMEVISPTCIALANTSMSGVIWGDSHAMCGGFGPASVYSTGRSTQSVTLANRKVKSPTKNAVVLAQLELAEDLTLPGPSP
jgi:hypothetical protein